MDDYDPNSILIEDALAKIKKLTKKISTYEYVNLIDSHDRTVFENIKSKLKVPNYDNSAMDGYALNIQSLANNKNLKIIGIFSRLAIRDKKKKYLKLIPNAWKLIELRMNNNSLFKDLKLFLDVNFPKKIRIKK